MFEYKPIKNKFTIAMLNIITKWFIKLTNKVNYSLTPLTDSSGYDYFINPRFKNCNTCVYNPIETVYFVLKTVFGRIDILSIQGINVDYSNSDKIFVTISTLRPGLVIGFHGKDIDRLTEILTTYFGQQVEIQINEVKNLRYTISNY